MTFVSFFYSPGTVYGLLHSAQALVGFLGPITHNAIFFGTMGQLNGTVYLISGAFLAIPFVLLGWVTAAVTSDTETNILSFWQNFLLWLHRKLSFNSSLRWSQGRKFHQNGISILVDKDIVFLFAAVRPATGSTAYNLLTTVHTEH